MTILNIRKTLRSVFGPRKYRITSSGEIHVFSTMPNTLRMGWYLFGRVADQQTQQRLEAYKSWIEVHKCST